MHRKSALCDRGRIGHDRRCRVIQGNLVRAAICVFMALTFVPMTAEATIRSVTGKTSRTYEGGGGYTYAEITILGSVARVDGSVGLYSVPAVIIYPRHGR